MLTCPKCGSERLIPLTFVPPLGKEKVDVPNRPIAKCVACGERTFVSVRIHRSLSSE
jgi:DNA-directed RNA polymerase subunit RPC12/RpoP